MRKEDSTAATEARDPRRSLVDFIEVYAIKEPPPGRAPPNRALTEALARRAVDGCRPIVLTLPRRVRCWPWPR